MKLPKYSLSILAGLASVASVSALSYSDVVSYNGQNGGLPLIGLPMLNTATGTVNGLFDITDSGYNPSLQSIVSATATFTFIDALLNETFTITLDGNAFLTQVNLPNLSTTTVPGPANDDVLGPALVTLDTTGQLAYQIKRTSGAFALLSAQLSAEAITKPVPDALPMGPALAMALGGAMWLRRRQLAKNA